MEDILRDRLIDCCQRYYLAYDKMADPDFEISRTGYKEKNSIAAEITDIGKELASIGGHTLLLKVGNSLPDPRWRSIVNSRWDGIDGWQS